MEADEELSISQNYRETKLTLHQVVQNSILDRYLMSLIFSNLHPKSYQDRSQ